MGLKNPGRCRNLLQETVNIISNGTIQMEKFARNGLCKNEKNQKMKKIEKTKI